MGLAGGLSGSVKAFFVFLVWTTPGLRRDVLGLRGQCDIPDPLRNLTHYCVPSSDASGATVRSTGSS